MSIKKYSTVLFWRGFTTFAGTAASRGDSTTSPRSTTPTAAVKSAFALLKEPQALEATPPLPLPFALSPPTMVVQQSTHTLSSHGCLRFCRHHGRRRQLHHLSLLHHPHYGCAATDKRRPAAFHRRPAAFHPRSGAGKPQPFHRTMRSITWKNCDGLLITFSFVFNRLACIISDERVVSLLQEAFCVQFNWVQRICFDLPFL